MTETSGASFPRFDSEDIRNLQTTEVITGLGETPRTTCFHASADQGEAMTRQGSAAVPPHGDSLTDQANLMRDLIHEELLRGLGRLFIVLRGRAPCPPALLRRVLIRLVRVLLSALVLHPRHVAVGPPVGIRPAVMLRLTPTTCLEVALVPLCRCRGTPWWSALRTSRAGQPTTISRAPPSPPTFVMPSRSVARSSLPVTRARR